MGTPPYLFTKENNFYGLLFVYPEEEAHSFAINRVAGK